MVRRRALLRRLPAAEALGSATVICTDKTGTLTQNEMTVRQAWLRTGGWSTSGVGYDPRGEFRSVESTGKLQSSADLCTLLTTGLLCNNATLGREEGRWVAIGEPTEAALLTAARKAECEKPADSDRDFEFPFSSTRKRMTRIDPGPPPGGRHMSKARPR